MQAILDFLSIERILALPWYVGYTGLGLIVLLFIASFWSLIYLQPLRAITRFVLGVAIAIVLSQRGDLITQWVDQGLAMIPS